MHWGGSHGRSPTTLRQETPVSLISMQDEEEAVGRLIEYMQAMQGQPLWAYEESSLQRPRLGSAAALQFLVQSLVRVKFSYVTQYVSTYARSVLVEQLRSTSLGQCKCR